MPKCGMPECTASTPKARGSAAAEGWTCVDIQGPSGNKYLNACPDHPAKDVTKAVVDLLTRTAKS